MWNILSIVGLLIPLIISVLFNYLIFDKTRKLIIFIPMVFNQYIFISTIQFFLVDVFYNESIDLFIYKIIYAFMTFNNFVLLPILQIQYDRYRNHEILQGLFLASVKCIKKQIIFIVIFFMLVIIFIYILQNINQVILSVTFIQIIYGQTISVFYISLGVIIIPELINEIFMSQNKDYNYALIGYYYEKKKACKLFNNLDDEIKNEFNSVTDDDDETKEKHGLIKSNSYEFKQLNLTLDIKYYNYRIQKCIKFLNEHSHIDESEIKVGNGLKFLRLFIVAFIVILVILQYFVLIPIVQLPFQQKNNYIPVIQTILIFGLIQVSLFNINSKGLFKTKLHYFPYNLNSQDSIINFNIYLNQSLFPLIQNVCLIFDLNQTGFQRFSYQIIDMMEWQTKNIRKALLIQPVLLTIVMVWVQCVNANTLSRNQKFEDEYDFRNNKEQGMQIYTFPDRYEIEMN